MARAELPDQNRSFHNARAVRWRLHKKAVVQPPEPERAFKGLGVAEAYCASGSKSEGFVQRRPHHALGAPPGAGQPAARGSSDCRWRR